MPPGRSHPCEPWLDFQAGQYAFPLFGFSHTAPFRFSASLSKPHSGLTVRQSILERPEGVSSAGEVQYWFNFNGDKSIHCKAGSDNQLSLHYDNGIQEVKGVKHNLYFGSTFSRTFSERLSFAGVEMFVDDRWSVNTRLIFDSAKRVWQLEERAHYIR
jgi:hypothetical protein